uniref:Glutamine--fructose-6-phosphate aminotransferase [isomerizing] n=1 Tax=uncultured bacterium CSL1 TaxID=1091565 RepID=G4WVB1_9BACT|nr:isomerizing glucosamine-fructose-6-phosphate aminotransferase [uncultured bacterium CSL1]
MCGIIGITGTRDVAPLLLEGLKRLEYRGYDSAGIATIQNGQILRARAQGKLVNLEQRLQESPLPGFTGIGHTRWATHGIPNETNAHPHATDRVAVVHNGIIENFRELREELVSKGYVFLSQTDTEIVPMLITYYLADGLSEADAVSMALKRLQGAYALGIVFRDRPDYVIGARNGPPLAIGYGDGEMFLGSDAMALAHLSSRLSYLEDGDWVELTPTQAIIHDREDKIISREIVSASYSGAAAGKGNYRHFMLKEIYEQPGVVGETLKAYYNPNHNRMQLPPLPFDLSTIDRVRLIGCGTSHYAGLVGSYWLESLAGLPSHAEIASEFRYRTPVLSKNELCIFISQSGETADTLATLRYAKQHGAPTLAIVNVPESSIAREADAVLLTYAGPEIGVASTKAFSTQLAILACLTLSVAHAKKNLSDDMASRLSEHLMQTPALIAEALHLDSTIEALAHSFSDVNDVLYLGRGTSFALAMEGALKLKEISYIHAEAYAAGEMKHGPIALIDEHVPVIVLAPSDTLFEKTASNLQEAAARGGRIILITDRQGQHEAGDAARATIVLPNTDAFAAPLVYAIPMQLLAYHIAVLRGTDIDQPRNLAKSVTVE